MRKRLAALLLGAMIAWSSLVLQAGADANSASRPHSTSSKQVKKIIFMIPDGFSTAYATNYRMYKGKETLLDPLLVGMVKTHSANSPVTDSAAAATAMATGFKTDNGMIGITPDKRERETILEAARSAGKATGLVATSTITYATPAAFSAHVESRNDESDIALQQLDRVDVLLGGGKQFFLPESMGGQQPSRNLVDEAKRNGYQFVENRDQLLAVKGSDGSKNVKNGKGGRGDTGGTDGTVDKLLGLFADGRMAPELDREMTQEPSLKEMTDKAIALLNQDPDGFFLMVEGSLIDWAGNSHDAAWAMKDTEAFEQAVETALQFAEKDRHTLVVIVGDHDTGGMSVGGYELYDAKPEVLRSVTATGEFMAGKVNIERSNLPEIVRQYTNIKLTDAEAATIRTSDNLAHAINDVISERALVGWTSFHHTGVDVQLYAYGPGSDRFRGLLDNTDLPKLMAAAMDIKLKGIQK